MSKHTQKPWVIEQEENCLYIVSDQNKSSDNPIICSLYEKDSVMMGVWLEPNENAEANARLIAAAPELLEALEAIIERWDTPLWKDAPHTGNYINAARLVVAKAKGE